MNKYNQGTRNFKTLKNNECVRTHLHQKYWRATLFKPEAVGGKSPEQPDYSALNIGLSILRDKPHDEHNIIVTPVLDHRGWTLPLCCFNIVKTLPLSGSRPEQIPWNISEDIKNSKS